MTESEKWVVYQRPWLDDDDKVEQKVQHYEIDSGGAAHIILDSGNMLVLSPGGNWQIRDFNVISSHE